MSLDRERVLSDVAEQLTRKPSSSMDEIARSAGISRATLHRQFAGRDSLVRALEELGLRRLTSAVEEARPEEGDPVEALRRVIAEAEPLAGFLAFLITENQLFEPGEVNAGWKRVDARVDALFRRGQECGVFRLDLTSAWLTEATYALITASAWAVQAGRVAARDSGPMATELLINGACRRSRP
ncbi:TetR/AcrR family transcriptional regulator [Streptomyces sp. N2-109]|uniref:TetR/AcrR family transcriptional regulator n=1 Tax=Streptomyces gossypii TaxID=2883101 RepID=A0ABT2JL84_9ACTN|nr:TetR/AcrR family transcriptional regulator [Streptomyces gossypii]MCT2588644.1 TetR/AcrR family transcriptional regulator [Streptomyces gossypii]